MSVERHAQQDDDEYKDTIRRLQERLAEGEQERARLAAAVTRQLDGLAAENRMLKARLQDMMQLLVAHQEAAGQVREACRAEAWQAGYNQRADEEGQVPRPRQAAREGRWLRAVPAFAAPAVLAASRVLRSKMILAPVAATALVVAAVPVMHTAEFRGRETRPQAVRAFSPAAGGGSSVFPPGGSPAADTTSASPPGGPSPTGSPSGSPPGTGVPVPGSPPTGSPAPPAGSPSADGSGSGTAAPTDSGTPTDTPSPSPADTTDTGTPAPPPTDTGSPAPSGTDTATPSPADSPAGTDTPACVPPAPSAGGP